MEIPVSGRGWESPALRRRLIKFFPEKGLAGEGARGIRDAGVVLCPDLSGSTARPSSRGTEGEMFAPSPTPVVCSPRARRGRAAVLLQAHGYQPAPPTSRGTCSPGNEGGAVPPSPLASQDHPPPFSRPRAGAPLSLSLSPSPRRGARWRGCPEQVALHERPRATPAAGPLSPTPFPETPTMKRSLPAHPPPPPSPPGSPAFPGHRRPRGNKEPQPGPLPAGGAYLLQGRQQHQRQRRQDPRRRSRYPAHGGEEGRRQGGPQQFRSAAGARGAGRGERRGGSGSGSCRELRSASAPACRSRLPL